MMGLWLLTILSWGIATQGAIANPIGSMRSHQQIDEHATNGQVAQQVLFRPETNYHHPNAASGVKVRLAFQSLDSKHELDLSDIWIPLQKRLEPGSISLLGQYLSCTVLTLSRPYPGPATSPEDGADPLFPQRCRIIKCPKDYLLRLSRLLARRTQHAG